MIAFLPFLSSGISYEDAFKGSRIKFSPLIFVNLNVGHTTEYFWRYFGEKFIFFGKNSERQFNGLLNSITQEGNRFIKYVEVKTASPQ